MRKIALIISACLLPLLVSCTVNDGSKPSEYALKGFCMDHIDNIFIMPVRALAGITDDSLLEEGFSADIESYEGHDIRVSLLSAQDSTFRITEVDPNSDFTLGVIIKMMPENECGREWRVSGQADYAETGTKFTAAFKVDRLDFNWVKTANSVSIKNTLNITGNIYFSTASSGTLLDKGAFKYYSTPVEDARYNYTYSK